MTSDGTGALPVAPLRSLKADEASAQENRILLLAPTSNDSKLTARLLTGAGCAVTECGSIEGLCQEIRSGCGAIVVAEEGVGPDSLQPLVAAVKAQPSWSDIPITIVTARGQAAQWRRHGLSAAGLGGNVTLLERPFHAETLISTVDVALRSRSRQYQVRELLQEQRSTGQRLQNILESISDAFVALDRNWRFIFVNPAFMKLLSARYSSPDELQGQSLWERLPEVTDYDGRRFLEEVMATQKPGVMEVYYEPAQAWLEIHAHPSPKMLSVYVRDITAPKNAEAALREAKEAAEAANRSKDRFLAVLSHELRTPLTPVLMAASAMELDPDLPADIKHEMAMIRRNVELETKLIDDLLDLSRITSGKLALRLEAMDVNTALRQVCLICRSPMLEKGIYLECDFDEEASVISADPARFQQVLWNLINNAIKFTPQGGRIQVASRRINGTQVQMRVQDNGIGIEPEVLPQIFNAFEQGNSRINRQFAGLGLGLAIAKALLELHQGTIEAASDGLGKGAVFTLTLPVAALGHEVNPAVLAQEPRMAASQMRLLVVEDHPDTARTLGILLGRAGFVVKTAGNVATALKLVADEPFDVLVSDLGLPDGTGYDLMRQVRQFHSLPGIAMSGYGMEEDIRKSREAGFSEQLVKPVSVRRLEQAIHKVLAAR